jgi:hypothetical protein
MVFAPNGDLYFGSVSVRYGEPTKGIWRIPAEALGAESGPCHAEQVLPGRLFPAVVGNKISFGPYAFLTKGPYAGDLLIVYDGDYYGKTVAGGRIFRAIRPGYRSIIDFVVSHPPFSPAGLAVNPEGDVFISDFGKGTILQYDSNGHFQRKYASLKNANQIAIGFDGTVYVTNATFDKNGMVEGGLFVYDPSGALLHSLTPQYCLRGVALGFLRGGGSGSDDGSSRRKPSQGENPIMETPSTTFLIEVLAGLTVAGLSAVAAYLYRGDKERKRVGEAPFVYVRRLDDLIKRGTMEGAENAIINARAIVAARNSLAQSLVSISSSLNSEIDKLAKQIGETSLIPGALTSGTERPKTDTDSRAAYESIQVLARIWP